jgi:hypothetical protein
MYNVLLKMTDGTVSLLTNRDRTEWTLATAKKHKQFVAAQVAAGKWTHVQYATITTA